MGSAHILAGLDWNLAIRGILVVLVGFVVLPGSIYLLLGTNLGARLGFSMAMGGLFGFLSILTLVWWIQPPAIGPRGVGPSWVAEEIYVYNPDDPAQPLHKALAELPAPDELPATAEEIVATVGDSLEAELPATPTLGDIKGAQYTNDAGEVVSGEDLVDEVGLTPDGVLNDWKLLATSDAGELQTAADAAFVESGYFKSPTEYKKLDVFKTGGNPTLEDDCPDADPEKQNSLIPDDPVCRVTSRIVKTFRLTAPPEYAIVQVQAVTVQEPVAGEPPPTPEIDADAPVVSILLVRDQGKVRAQQALWFVICASMFAFFALLLHFRDKVAMANRENEPARPGG